MLHAGYALANLLPLHGLDVAQHAVFAEVALREIVGRQGRGVIRRQCNKVMEDTCFACSVGLEGPDSLIGYRLQLSVVVFSTHQPVAVVRGDVFAFFSPGVKDLLTEVQRPVE